MTTFTSMLDAFGAALWRASWQGGLAVLAVWIVCRFAPSIPARFQAWLWRLAVLKFLIALLWAMPVDVPLLRTAPAGKALPAFSSAAPASMPVSNMAAPVRSGHAPISPWLIPFVIWGAAVAWQAGRLLLACRNATRLKKACRSSTDQRLIAQLAGLSKSIGLRRAPPVLEKDGLGSPLLVGMIWPSVVLPAATLVRLSGAELSMVLRHELAHARRRDLLWGFFGALVRTLFFFHPLAWLCERQLRLTQEIAADELAIALGQHDTVCYASLLVSVVGKIGPHRMIPNLSLGAAGSQQSLKRRLSAMRYMKRMPYRVVVAYTLVLGFASVLGIIPWRLVAAEEPAPAPAKVEQPEKTGSVRGRFVSYKDGALKIEDNTGTVYKNIVPDSATIFQWSDNDKGSYVPATSDALIQAQLGTYAMFGNAKGSTTIRIGARKSQTVGSFVSFKDDRLLVLGKNIGESYVKKYGNQIHYRKFRDDCPAFESIDGGEYQPVGPANKALANLKEGMTVTIHGAGDDNILLVQIGVPKAK